MKASLLLKRERGFSLAQFAATFDPDHPKQPTSPYESLDSKKLHKATDGALYGKGDAFICHPLPFKQTFDAQSELTATAISLPVLVNFKQRGFTCEFSTGRSGPFASRLAPTGKCIANVGVSLLTKGPVKSAQIAF
jgi:hypothetical protein